MAIEAAKLMVIVGADGTSEVAQQLGQVSQAVKGTAAEGQGLTMGFEGMDGAMGGMAAGMAMAAVETIGLTAVISTAVGALSWSVNAAGEAEMAQAKLGAVLRSTKEAAGMSQGALNELANSLSATSGVERDLVTNSEAVMLTFTQVGSEIFPQAMKAAMDMNAVMGGDLKSSVVQLGKALNDPAQGLTALKREGVSFTEAQISMIKAMQAAGDTMGAQKMILAELNTEFGGAAATMGNTMPGSTNKMNNSLKELGDTIGGGTIPALSGLTNVVTQAANGLNFMLSWDQRARATLADTNAELVRSGISYAEYKDKIIDVGIKTGELNPKFREMIGTYGDTDAKVSKLIGEMGGLSEAQFTAGRSAMAMAANFANAPDTGWLLNMEGEINKVSAALQGMMTRYTEQANDVNLVDSAFKAHVITLETYTADLQKAADGNLVMSANERAGLTIDVQKADITDKITKAYADQQKAIDAQNKALEQQITVGRKAAEENFSLAESLKGVTLAAEKKIAMDQLKKSVDDLGLSGDAAARVLNGAGLAMGFVTERSIAEEAGIKKLTLAMAAGVITGDQFNKGIGELHTGLQKGTMDVDGMIEKFAGFPTGMDPATKAFAQMEQRSLAAQTQIGTMSTQAPTQMAAASTLLTNANKTIGLSFDAMGLTADNASIKIGGIEGSADALRDWIEKYSPLTITVNVVQHGGIPSLGAGMGAGGYVTNIRDANKMALGGDVAAGELYRVNERGRTAEYFRPNVDGEVLPLGPAEGAGGGAKGSTYNLYFTATQVDEGDVLRALGKAEYLYG